MRPSGTGANGVLLVGEALGEQEAIAGEPFVGKAGQTLERNLQRGGMTKSDFLIANTIFCRPPNNKLNGQPYAAEAIKHCQPNLDGVISSYRPKCIVALGVTAFNRLLPEIASTPGVGLLDSKKRKGARGYVFWSDRYQTWIIPTIHPSFILRGKTAWAQVLIHDCQRAVDVARAGYRYDTHDYLLDPIPLAAMQWADEFDAYAAAHPDCYLSCDIETPEKGPDEEELDLEDSSDYTILRCGYSYKAQHALSIPWGNGYEAIHRRLLSSPAAKCWWNGAYDQPRIIATGMTIEGASHDAMDAWHVLNSDLKKSLNFVAPFFCHGQKMWKHLAGAEPAFYNATDADVAGRIMSGVVPLLKKNGMWPVYQEFICELDPVFSAMTRAGMPLDTAGRIESSKKLIERNDAVRLAIENLVPLECKTLQPKDGYKKPPADKTGLVEVTFNGVRKRVCPGCGLLAPPKSHFTTYKRKVNPCAGLAAEERIEGDQRWAKVLPFTPSPKGIMKYQQYHHHPIIFQGRGDDRRATTDAKAIRTLIGKHPKDPFYPLVLESREYEKLGGTYIGWFDPLSGSIQGGFPVGRDGRVHGIFRHTPSTLRSSMVSPNLQNVPRGNDSEVQRWVKQMFVTGPDQLFVKADYAGIEAILVGVKAGDKDFFRLANIDVHSYFTIYNLHRQGVVTAADLPALSMDDAELAGALAQVKKRFPSARDIGKRCIHAGNYRVGASKLHDEYPQWFPRVKDAAVVLGFFYELFPGISKWHERLCLQVDRSAVARNSFGHVHRFYQVLTWEKRGTEWIWSYGDDAKRLIAFGPQSDAAFIGKRALKRCYYDYPESMARWLRLFIHDDIFAECPQSRADEAASILQFEMEKPIPEIPLDPTWGYGTHLAIKTEGKRGRCWADMY